MAGEELTGRDWTAGVDVETPSTGELRAAISNAMVGLKKQFYGKGPESARTYIQDVYVFCVLEGGLTRNEQTLIEAGEQELVFQYRHRFQQAMRDTCTAAIAELTGRQVVGYQSTVVFDGRARFVEIFVLDAPL